MGQAFLYGNGGSGSGGTLTVTAPAGVTCTVSKDGKTKTKTVDQYGYATFKGLDTGTWTVTISDGSQTSPAYTVTIVADYAVTVSFFSATIAVTYPEGSTCTCSDGSTTLTAPDTSGSYTFTVPNAGTWTITIQDGGQVKSTTVVITTNGQSESKDVRYTQHIYNRGDQCTDITGGWATSKGANGTVTVNTDNIYLYNKGNSSSTGNSSVAYTKNKIDLTGVKTLRLVATGAVNSVQDTSEKVSLSFGVFDNTTDMGASANIKNAIAYFDIPDNEEETEYLLDVGSVSGSYYVAVTCNLYGAKITINEVEEALW